MALLEKKIPVIVSVDNSMSDEEALKALKKAAFLKGRVRPMTHSLSERVNALAEKQMDADFVIFVKASAALAVANAFNRLDNVTNAYEIDPRNVASARGE